MHGIVSENFSTRNYSFFPFAQNIRFKVGCYRTVPYSYSTDTVL